MGRSRGFQGRHGYIDTVTGRDARPYRRRRVEMLALLVAVCVFASLALEGLFSIFRPEDI
jgi:hypothetical protein